MAHWRTSNRLACDAPLGLLAGQNRGWADRRLVRSVVRLALTAEDKRHAREVLLELLATAGWKSGQASCASVRARCWEAPGWRR
jgi:hypothetical protein